MFLMEDGDAEKLIKMLINYTSMELSFMIEEYKKQMGRKPEKLYIPRIKILGLDCEFYDESKAALYSKPKDEEFDA